MNAMDEVRIGMRVVDSTGDDVGEVEDLKAGDPAAVTTEGQQMESGGGLIGDLAEGLSGGSDVDPQAFAQLSRVGYIKIDRKGFLGGHAYASAEQIQAVDGDTIRLSVTPDQLYGG